MNLSVVIPIYNSEEFLEECLESVISGIKYSDEVLLVNDGSTDRSGEICKRYACLNGNIRYIETQNCGVSHARNLGIKESKSNYIMFVDSDDILADNWRQNVEGGLKCAPDIVYYNKSFKKQLCKSDIIKTLLKDNEEIQHLMMPSSKVFSRKMLIKNHLQFNEKIINGEDLLFNLGAIISANSYRCCSESIYRYRINYKSITHSFRKGLLESDKEFHMALKRDYLAYVGDEQRKKMIKGAVVMFIQKMAIADNMERGMILEQINNHPYADCIKDYARCSLKEKICFWLVMRKMKRTLIIVGKLLSIKNIRRKSIIINI